LPSRKEMAAIAETHLDIKAILAQLQPAPASPTPLAAKPVPRKRVAIARDDAFHFYYASNLDYLRENGLEPVEFSPLHDQKLPTDISGLIFGGGFPEIFGTALAENSAMRREVKSALTNGLPCYAECGGLMYLADEIVELTGKRLPMAGLVPGAVTMTRNLQNFGYCVAETNKSEAPYHGHEFHYSRWEREEQCSNRWQVRRRRGGPGRSEGYQARRLHASYVHLFWKQSPGLLSHLLSDNREIQS
jgi:cobyrinic acid a,c-diamide synthase